jgi:hypothetical protein
MVTISRGRPGIEYRVFYEAANGLTTFNYNTTPDDSGIIPSINLGVASNSGSLTIQYKGLIDIPADGQYTFWLTADDGALLYLDNSQLIDNGGHHSPVTVSQTITLSKGLHDIRIPYGQDGGEWALKLEWQGPGLARQDVPASVLFHEGDGDLPVAIPGNVKKSITPVKPFTVMILPGEIVLSVNEPGPHRVDIFGINGRIIKTFSADAPASHAVDRKALPSCIAIARVKTNQGMRIERIVFSGKRGIAY